MGLSTRFISVLINVYWFYIFVEFIMVLCLINSYKLLEMAPIYFTTGNWSEAPCFRTLCQRFLASFEKNSYLQILFCFHMSPINDTFEVTLRKKLSKRSQVIAVVSQRPPLFPTIVAITKCCVETDSRGLRKMRRDISALEPPSPPWPQYRRCFPYEGDAPDHMFCISYILPSPT